MPDPTLPPVGSLWRHKDGERRFVMNAELFPFSRKPCPVKVAVVAPSGETYMTTMEFADWLSWQADADRIDIEPAIAPRGQEE